MSATRAILAAASAMGLCGVILLAAGSHAAGSNATVAGQMLLAHAPAVMALTLGRERERLHPQIGLAAPLVMMAGVALFSADLAWRAFRLTRMFPMAAPIGGGAIMLGWALAAIAALLAPRQNA